MMDLGLTSTDIESKLRAFPDLDDISDEIDDLIDEENYILSVTVRMQGFIPTDVSTTKHVRLRALCRAIVKLRVAAEVQEEWTHESSKLSIKRREKADKLEAMIRNNPEAISADYDSTKQRGSWQYDTDGTRSAPGLAFDWNNVNGG